MVIVYIIIIAIAVILAWVAMTFNSLIRLRNNTKEAWSDIDVQLKRRYDLIPNLINTVKGYAEHEKDLLEKVTLARAAAMGATATADKAKAENMLTDTLKSLLQSQRITQT